MSGPEGSTAGEDTGFLRAVRQAGVIPEPVKVTGIGSFFFERILPLLSRVKLVKSPGNDEGAACWVWMANDRFLEKCALWKNQYGIVVNSDEATGARGLPTLAPWSMAANWRQKPDN